MGGIEPGDDGLPLGGGVVTKWSPEFVRRPTSVVEHNGDQANAVYRGSLDELLGSRDMETRRKSDTVLDKADW
jgi:hypothetical protein